ncbi:bacillithiol biosynthesis deacetylase BshB2 [Sporosarcina ureilytica]|uniref:Bacillithiol biosynthesis deacetylase BshB2 n=1 Tax=Sporosarcina ureilytica TaxID=298596 RepID=A0A1D8JJK3_9BACL|nr:bacillithiol biosynthesis deacetylase BshB2 [Sporosarcina ureilytica]AOV08891.1 bacillithiol biosynthesis deacetylase BshB2 [Sporosarcina ureilytica]
MIEKERHVLIILPHPDDEAFGISGSIAAYRKMGVPVTYACLTLGEMGRNLGNPQFATRETLPEIRKAELLKACEAMGLDDLRMMGLRDKTLEFEDDEDMIKLVEDVIEETNPSLVISFYPGFSVHPDHEATARAVVRAIRRMKEEERPKLYAVAFANNTKEILGTPDIIHDVEETVDQKLAALKAHISQTVWMMKETEAKLKQNDPEMIKWLRYERFFSYKWHADFE